MSSSSTDVSDFAISKRTMCVVSGSVVRSIIVIANDLTLSEAPDQERVGNSLFPPASRQANLVGMLPASSKPSLAAALVKASVLDELPLLEELPVLAVSVFEQEFAPYGPPRARAERVKRIANNRAFSLGAFFMGLFLQELVSEGKGVKVLRFGAIDSTNSEAIRRAKNGEPEGTIIVADTQTAGRGRGGSTWESPPGKNLYLSFLFRPTSSPEKAVSMTRMAADVVCETLGGLKEGGVSFTIKPPNDILLNGKKVAGILCEMESESGRTSWVVCGIGINVNSEPADFSPEVRKIAISLKMVFGREFDREEILQRLMAKMRERYENFVR